MSGKIFVSVLLIIIIGIFVIINWAKLSFKSNIEQDAKFIFSAKEDLSGNLILEFQGYKILLDYDLSYNIYGTSEYIIANVILPKLNDVQLKACKNITDIKESKGKLYAIIYTSWGYQGEKFRNRLEKKLTQISACINQ